MNPPSPMPSLPSPSGPDFEPSRVPRTLGVPPRSDMLDFGDILAAWPAIVAGGIVLSMLIVTVGLLQPRTFTSHASFIPQQRGAQGNLNSLAAQFGVSVQSGPPGQSPQFYADLVKTRDLFVGLLDSSYQAHGPAGTTRVILADALRAKGQTPELKQDAALQKLRMLIDAGVSQKTGVVSLSVKMPSSELSRLVSARVLELVNRFNLEIRQSQAASERRFTELRQKEALAELRQAEDRLKQFLDENRTWSGSNQLVFAHDRLTSEVDLRRQTYASLTQAFEQAKIDEVRDTPVITVIENPVAPSRPDSRGLVSKAALGAIGGGMLGILLAWFRRRTAAPHPFTRSVGA